MTAKETKHTPLHHHFNDGGYHGDCKRCQLEHAAPKLLKALKAFLDCQSECFLAYHDTSDCPDDCVICQARDAIYEAEGK